MKKTTLIGLLVVVVILAIFSVSKYNGMVSQDEAVTTAWSNVETQYQRRADLIPNLVNTVKGYAAHEQNTLQGVMEARAKATQMTIDADNLTPEKLKEYQAAQGQVASALGRLMMITEQYPNLKADAQFTTLQAQLEGTENRIAESRRVYNNAVQEYNTTIRRFPNNVFAGLFGFDKRVKFEATEGSEKAPEVKF